MPKKFGMHPFVNNVALCLGDKIEILPQGTLAEKALA